MDTQIRDNFIEEVRQASGEKHDSRYHAWAKWVDAVDASKKNGYAFEGPFINSGTVEVEVGTPRVILSTVVRGSNKYHTRHYSIVVMAADGTLTSEPIGTDDFTPGWALRIRNEVAGLLERLRDSPAPSGAGVWLDGTPEVALAYLQVMARLKEIDLEITDWVISSEGKLLNVEIEQAGERYWAAPDEASVIIADAITNVGGAGD